MPDSPHSDVLVVGAGPVGLTTAILLGRSGRRVTVVERWPRRYPRPRAVHFDDEVARVFAQAGVAGAMAEFGEGADAYDWRNATGQTLLHFDFSGMGPSGWPTSTMSHQPSLERALEDLLVAMPGMTLLRGTTAEAITDHGDRVEMCASGPDGPLRLTAGWLVGCDGANSTVRAAIGSPTTDLGFFYDWLIVDVLPHEPRQWCPANLQICDPRRPTTAVSGGPGRRRWEFMRLPEETVEALNTEETAWRLLAPWGMTPRNATLERHAVYTFQARWTEQWRSGRLLLAGDAAHLMPPFAGQGMCSGIRDAANLAWKLDLVLAGIAGPELLDTYTAERRAHVQHAIGMSVELGKVICVMDPDVAAQRDARMTGLGGDPAKVLPPLPPPRLTDGLLLRTADGSPAPGAGLLSPQPRVTLDGRAGLLDDVVGQGFVVAAAFDPAAALRPDQLGFLRDIGAHLVHLGGEVRDLDGSYLPYLAGHGATAVVRRPDHYVFAMAADACGLAVAVDDLRHQLTARREHREDER